MVQKIQQLGLGSLAAAVLETHAAFALLAAQGLYLAEPLLASWWPRPSLQALARQLEDPQQRHSLARALRAAQ